jgi:hypothetical protein
MRYIEVPGRIDEHDRLILDESLDVIKPQRVKIDIWFRDEDEEDYREETKEEILEGIGRGFQDCLEGRTSPVGEKWNEFTIETTGTIDDEGRLILDEPLKTTKHQFVDVVIWFIRNHKSDFEVLDRGNLQQEPEVLGKEPIGSHLFLATSVY